MKYIGFGKFSKSYIYLLLALIFKLLDENFLAMTSVSPHSNKDILYIEPVLSKHIIVQKLYQYASYIIGGIIIKLYLKYKTKSKTDNQIFSRPKKKVFIFAESLSLILYKRETKKNPIMEIIIVSIFYVLNMEIIDICFHFNLGNLNIWTLDLLFMILFMKKYFIIKFYNFQKCSFIFLLSTVSVILIISSTLPIMDNNSKDNKLDVSHRILFNLVDNNYFLYILIFIIINVKRIMISYARVKAKLLMDFKYISPYTILIYIGIFGLIIISIELTFSTIYECTDKYQNFCYVKFSDDSNITYFDNIEIYFSKLSKESIGKLLLEILISYPLFLIINFLKLAFEFWMIIKLNPIFVLILNSLAYTVNYLLYFIFNYSEEILIQFCILESAEIISLICYMIYLEIIELRFCGFDTYLSRNLLSLSINEFDEDKSVSEEEEDDKTDKISEFSIYPKDTIYD